jgi:uncharacterized protein (TIGR02145 family)
MKMHNIAYIAAFAVISMLIPSCSNNENDDDSREKCPMNFSAQITAIVRSEGNSFTNGDKIGLFVTTTDYKVAGSRYLDNTLLTYNNGSITSAQTLYYPDWTSSCDFLAYYPYSDDGATVGTALIPVSTKADQTKDADYYVSDFMVAETSSTPTAETVTLPFSHRLSKIDLVFNTDSKSVAEAVKNSSSAVVAGISTTGQYDANDKCFKNLSDASTVTLHGAWSDATSTEKGVYSLSGMSVIAIPQDLSNSTIVISAGDRSYACKFPDTMALESGKRHTMTIEHMSGASASTIKVTISDWTVGTPGANTSYDTKPYFNISSLDFSVSRVYRLYTNDGRLLGEVCREYLSNASIDAEAIVYYAGCNLKNGTLLQVVGNDNAKCGGSVSWNDDNTLTYTEGNGSKVSTLYLNYDGVIVNESNTDDYRLGNATAYMLSDSRGSSETIKYPVVKIATQYWMQDQLRTAKYNDGTAIACNNDDTKATTAGYYLNANEYYYNAAAVTSQKLAPAGWRLPTTSDVETLTNYVGSKAAYKLKTASGWTAADNVTAGSNVTGFSAKGLGMYLIDKESQTIAYGFSGQYFCMWRMADAAGTTVANSAMALMNTSDELKAISQTYAMQAYSVRCLRK